MASIILRRYSSLLAPKRVSGALTAVEAVLHRHHRLHHDLSSAVLTADLFTFVNPLFSSIESRGFHVKSGPLDYRASAVVQAEHAVADYGLYDEEKVSKVIDSSTSGSDEGLEIAKLGISQEIVDALAKRGITKLFPIQKAVLEPAMQGRDMFGRARTGTGKTLAFGIPIMDRILRINAKDGPGKYPLALVMAPTRELARQVEKEFYESASRLETICVYGGTPISRQMRQLDYGVDVVVGTPGRIIDLMKRGALILNYVKFVVLDEADQMLNVGFAEDVETILSKLPQQRQSMMFSATMPSWIKNLTRNYLQNPLTIDLVGDSDQKLADGISLFSIASDMYSKASIIGPLITEHAKGGKCIVFTQTKRDADKLAYAMGKNFRCEALHGDISQSQRERTLSGFRDGHFNILVATDVAARGLDVPNVDLIIHYELPTTSETFVHRSGRTGRAGKKGTAILIYTPEQGRAVRVIERDVGCRFQELPKISVEGGKDMFNDMGGWRGREYGDMRSGGRFGGRGDSGFGRSPGHGGFGRSSGYDGSFSGRPNTNQSGNFGSPGFRRSSGFGESGASNRSSRFGDFGFGRSSGSGDAGSGRSTGQGHSSAFGEFSSGRSGGFGEFGSGRSGRLGSLGDEKDENMNSGRRPF